jgi:hypothetical protein
MTQAVIDGCLLGVDQSVNDGGRSYLLPMPVLHARQRLAKEFHRSTGAVATAPASSSTCGPMPRAPMAFSGSVATATDHAGTSGCRSKICPRRQCSFERSDFEFSRLQFS